MSGHPPALVVVVLAGFATLVYFGSGARTPDKGTQSALKSTKETYTGVRSHDDKPESTITIHSPTGDQWAVSLYAGGVPYQEKSQSASKWTYDYTVHRYPVDFNADLGAWAGARVGDADDSTGLDMGLRYSPVRLAYGIIAPDLLISPHQAGIGLSVYPPAQSVPEFFQHLGIGVGYLVDYAGGHGWVPYLALSTRF